MNCICGCNTRLGRGQVELNLLAGEVAVELVVWDKVRALGSPVAADEVETLIAAGAPRYQRLLGAIHAAEEPGDGELAATHDWVAESREARQRLHGELPVPKKKVKLSGAEKARIDRRHPERSFSGDSSPAADAPAAVGTAAGGAPAAASATPAPAAEDAGTEPLLEALLVVALEDVRAGRPEEAKRALRRFLSEGS